MHAERGIARLILCCCHWAANWPHPALSGGGRIVGSRTALSRSFVAQNAVLAFQGGAFTNLTHRRSLE